MEGTKKYYIFFFQKKERERLGKKKGGGAMKEIETVGGKRTPVDATSSEGKTRVGERGVLGKGGGGWSGRR